MVHRGGVFAQHSVPLEIGLGNVIEVMAADFRTEVDVARRLLDRLQPDTLILDELHRHLRNSPHENVCACHLRDRVVAILRQPVRIERLSPLVVQDVLEPMFLQESHGVFKFAGKAGVLPINDRIDVFLQQNFQQRPRSAARARTQRTGDFRRKVAQHGNDAVGITGERFEKMTIALGPLTGREIRPVFI